MPSSAAEENSGHQVASEPGRLDSPFVTVIMPVRNEQEFIERSLGAVVGQEYPRDKLEILVVDGMSTDDTRSVVSSLMRGQSRITVLDNPAGIVPAAMNIGIAKAKGEIIIRVDGHCEIAPDYVRRCVAHLRNDSIDAVGGAIETVGETTVARIVAVAMSSLFGVGGSEFRTVRNKDLLVDTVPFPAYPRAVVQRLGKFDEELVRNQDDEYNYRLREAGGRILLAADVRSRYYSRSTVGGVWRQHFQYGYWKVRVMQKHPGQMRLRHFIPSFFVGSILFMGFLFPFLSFARWLLLIIGGSYALANIIASVWGTKETGIVGVALLPVVFGALHISYGLGFLTGLFKFRSRWQDEPA